MLMFRDFAHDKISEFRTWSGHSVPRFSHRRSLQFTFTTFFAEQIFCTVFPNSATAVDDCAFATYFPHHIGFPLAVAITFILLQTPRKSTIQNEKGVCSRPTPHSSILSAGIRQPTRRLCSRIGCQSRAPCCLSPIQSHQRLRCDGSSECKGAGTPVRVAGLAEENVILCGILSLPAMSLASRFVSFSLLTYAAFLLSS